MSNILKFTKPLSASKPRQLVTDLGPHLDDLESLVVIGFKRNGEEVSGWCSEDMAMTFVHVDTVKQRILNSFMGDE